MNVIDASYQIEQPTYTGTGALRFIEKVARTCYKSEALISETSAEKLVKKLIASGHEAMLEHLSVTVRIICDRGISHELVRHRIASFAQESTRYCNYKDEVTFIRPCFTPMYSPQYALWESNCRLTEQNYKTLLEEGWTPQEARTVLPNSLKTEVVMTANIREWRHFFKLRTSISAHPQMREITIPMLFEFKGIFPILFEEV